MRSVIGLIVAVLLGSDLVAQSLGELAQRERKRRESLPRGTTTKVYSDRDVEPSWTGWRPWQAPDDTFTVNMPGKPTVTYDSVPIGMPYGSVRRVIYRARDTASRREFAVAVAEYPREWVRLYRSSIATEFQGSARLPFESCCLMLTQLPLEGCLAMFYRGDRVQLAGCLVGTRFYQLLVQAPPDDTFGRADDPAGLDPFFRSFRPSQ